MLKKLMIIDDDSDDRELFSEALTSIAPSISCRQAGDAEEALQMLSQEQHLPEVIFLDINLPGMSGWECLVNLKKIDRVKEIPVIIYSTSSHKRDIEIAKDLGAACFITKPDDYKILGILLKKMVQTSTEDFKDTRFRIQDDCFGSNGNIHHFTSFNNN